MNLQEFIYEFFYMSCFLFANLILRLEILRVIARGKSSAGLNCPEDIPLGRRIFPWRRSQVSWPYLKKDQKLKTSFFK
jgi:hypothetical protein